MLENLESFSTLAVLSVGAVFGLKHATEVDHVVAISTIVSQHKSLRRSAVIGALWGAGHTASLLLIGGLVLLTNVAIPERLGRWLEFCVALMIIALGVSALWRSLRRSAEIHVHKHSHDGVSHVHIHFHENETKHEPSARSLHSHAVSRVGIKPLLIGTMHGLAGSGALTLLILTQISSPWIGVLYLVLFGLGSVLGMVLMSGLIGLPFALTSRNLTNLNYRLQLVAAVMSICFGVWYGYTSGSRSGLF